MILSFFHNNIYPKIEEHEIPLPFQNKIKLWDPTLRLYTH